MLTLTLGDHSYPLEPAAVSALRFRAAWGQSAAGPLDWDSPKKAEALLLRLVHSMIPPETRPELAQLARQARKEETFVLQAVKARAALLAPDPLRPAPTADAPAEPFDEYRLLALMAVAGVDYALIYELPLLHLLSVVEHACALRDPERRSYRPMSGTEMAVLYPRRRREPACGG